MNAEKLKQLGDKAQKLGRLAESEGWAVLKEIVEREERKFEADVLAALRKENGVDQNEVRAMFKAFDLVKYLLAHPEKAEKTLQNALRKATAIEEVKQIG